MDSLEKSTTRSTPTPDTSPQDVKPISKEQIEKFYSRLLKSCIKICRQEPNSNECAKDLAQNTILRALETRSPYKGKGDGGLFSWLFTIALDIYRQQIEKRSGKIFRDPFLASPITDKSESESGSVLNLPDLRTPDALSQIYVGELVNKIKGRLTPKEKEVFPLLLAGMNPGEIAEKINRHPSRVSNLILGIRKKIRKLGIEKEIL